MRLVFGGNCSNSSSIAREIARQLGFDFYPIERKTFSDTEMLVRIPEDAIPYVIDSDIIYVQSTAPAQSEHILELFLTIDNLVRKGARSIDVVVPYLAHARQDQEFRLGEAISSKTIMRIIKSLGAARLFTVDVHFRREPGWCRFPLNGREGEYKNVEHEKEDYIELYNITAAKALARYIKENLGIARAVIVIPDKGGNPIGRPVNEIIRGPVVYLTKVRKSEVDVSIVSPIENDLDGENVVVFDDIISTGRTIVGTVKNLRAHNAGRIILAATHTLNLDNARQRILNAGVEKIVATDTMVTEDSLVPVAPVIGEALKQVLREGPLSA